MILILMLKVTSSGCDERLVEHFGISAEGELRKVAEMKRKLEAPAPAPASAPAPFESIAAVRSVY